MRLTTSHRWPALLMVLALAAGGLIASGIGPAQAATDARPARPNLPTRLRVLPLGDSITYGVGSSTRSSYRSDLYAALQAQGIPVDFVGSQRSGQGPDLDNEGHSGWSIKRIAKITNRRMATYRPNLVLLHLGTNDLNDGEAKAAGAPERLARLIDQILAAEPKVTVLVSTLVPSRRGATDRRISAYNKAITDLVGKRQAAGRHVRLVEPQLTPADLHDYLHPNDAGYAKMASAFAQGIQAVQAAGWLSEPVGGLAGPPACLNKADRWASRGPVMSGVAASGREVRFADLDGDRREDYLVLDSDTGALHAWINEGAGRWRRLGRIASGVGAPAGQVRFADLDGDGRDDYLVVNPQTGSVRAWLNDGVDQADGQWLSAGVIASGVRVAGGQVQFADLDGDRRADYLVVSQQSGAVRAWLNDGAQVPGDHWLPRGRIRSGVGAIGSQVRFADISCDDRDDYLVINPDGSVRAWVNAGADRAGDHWAARGRIASGVDAAGNQVQFANFDGDGRSDYVLVDPVTGAARVWINQSGRSGEEKTRCATTASGWADRGTVATGVGAPSRQVRFADLNGDGRDDYLVLDPRDGSVRAWINTGASTGRRWQSRGTVSTGAGAPSSQVRFADLDGDGRDDYLVVDPDTGSVRAWLNDGADRSGDHWLARGVVAVGVGLDRPSIEFADLNGDGRDDYLVLGTPGTLPGSVTAWANNGIDTGKPWKSMGLVAAGSRSAAASSSWLGQFDCDRRADYLKLDPASGAVRLWTRSGDGWAAHGEVNAGRAPADRIRLADLDGDGRNDYLVLAPRTGAVHAYLNRGGH